MGGIRQNKTGESEIGHGGGVKSLLCMCAIQEEQERGGVHNSLISMRVVLLELLLSREEEEEEEEEVAACWLTLCAAALHGDGTSCF